MAEFPSEAFGLIVKVADMLRKGTPIKDKLTVGNLVMQSVLSITKLIEQQQQQIEQQNKDIAKLHEDLIKAISRHKALEDKS